MTLASEVSDLSTVVRALEAVELAGTLRETGPYTLLAPTNDAIQRTIPGFDSLFAEEYRDSLRTLLAYHVVRGRLTAADVGDSLHVSTLLDRPLLLHHPTATAPLRIAGHNALRTLEAQNGVLHILPALLYPPPDTLAAKAEDDF